MLVPSRSFVAAALVLLGFFGAENEVGVVGSTISTTTSPTTTAVQSAGTCEARTINYITDSLPQQCLRKEWNGFNGTGTGGSLIVAHDELEGQENITTTSASLIPSTTAAETAEASATDLESGELGEASFLSFEEWKKQTLEKAGQANANIGNKKSGEGKKRDTDNFQNNLDSLGDEGEIDLDFSSFSSGGKGDDAGKTAEAGDAEVGQEPQETEEGGKRKDQYRSKDAGKTCKERFSYASFDAGATIVKTHPGAKNSKAVLIENKDSYMLSECATENKFVIIELSEDIWIDTVVLANYEFFSSQIRTFRVSVSDRYPVKIDKWKDVGTYEARNSREIQAFLIENPQIWARYIRIEFLSHYGNEYYCPLSLVRVHGTRMLESWKEQEASNDEDEGESEEEEAYVPDAVADVVQEEEKLKAAAEELLKAAHQAEPALNGIKANDTVGGASTDQKITPWIKFNFFEVASPNWLEDVCLPGEAPVKQSIIIESTGTANLTSTTSSTNMSSPTSTPTSETTSSSVPTATAISPTKVEPVVTSSSAIKESSASISVPSNSTSSPEMPVSSTSSPPGSKSQNITSTPKNKTTSTSSASSSLPTIQESFFKAVSRRLNFLETNSTLSLKYIEEQSRILREAFTKVEKKQLQKTNTFLDTLNSTVLGELRQFRQQYDEIWQSTIISLESQREESRREILAVTSRLNILADEVVFQKRMSIVQSVLVLLCLGLVIFTHVSGGGPLDYASMNSRMRLLSGYGMESPIESPPQSPEYSRRREPMRGGRPWLEVDQRRQRGDGSGGSRSRSRGDESPQTPMSAYSEVEEVEMTPPSGADDIFVGTEAELPALPTEEVDSPEPSKPVYHRAGTFGDSAAPQVPDEIVITAPEIPPQSPKRTPRKRKSIRQQASPPASEAGDDSANIPDPTSSPLPEPQPIPQLDFPDESIPASSLPNRSTSNLDLSLTLPPRLPSPPPEPFQLSTDRLDNTNGNDIGVAVPMSIGNGNTKSTPSSFHVHQPQPNLYSSPAVQPPSSPRVQAQTPEQSSPTSNRHKRQSFSIARKPLPALPPDP
ncbi:uncharacterized protein PAC_09190 [Phialocephala subalpina]|uniref:SUN domain-containing protein n=1 Tax=Phialocephala subalpina TaxID=576137 RepID=A0A1L7X2T6_9HELO|nr:uncharacterized protein PAC_09190 [Phialocephala subalpina]